MSWQFKWRYKFISRSDKKIGKNIFEIREKYFRIIRSVYRSTPDSKLLEYLPKMGGNSVFLFCGGRSLLDQSRLQWMNCLEANNQRILKQKIESQLYSTAGDVTRSLDDWRGGGLLLLYLTRWVEYCIDQQRVHTHEMSSVSISCAVFLTHDWFVKMLQIIPSRCSRTYPVISKSYNIKYVH